MSDDGLTYPAEAMRQACAEAARLRAENERLEQVEFIHNGCEGLRRSDNAYLINRAERAEAENERMRAQNNEWRATAEHALTVIDRLRRQVAAVEALAGELERRGAYVTGWQGHAAKKIRAALATGAEVRDA